MWGGRGVESGRSSYRVESEKPVGTGNVEVDKHFLVWEGELSEEDMDAMTPAAAMVGVQLDRGAGGAVGGG